MVLIVSVFFLYSFSTSIYYFYIRNLGDDNIESRPEFEGHGLQHPPLASFTCVIDLCVCKLMKLCADGASCGSGEPRDLVTQ